jgi:hypothetical protein
MPDAERKDLRREFAATVRRFEPCLAVGLIVLFLGRLVCRHLAPGRCQHEGSEIRASGRFNRGKILFLNSQALRQRPQAHSGLFVLRINEQRFELVVRHCGDDVFFETTGLPAEQKSAQLPRELGPARRVLSFVIGKASVAS